MKKSLKEFELECISAKMQLIQSAKSRALALPKKSQDEFLRRVEQKNLLQTVGVPAAGAGASGGSSVASSSAKSNQ